MAKATPVLQTILGSDRQRGGEDTLQYKEYPGGFLALESAGSPTNLAMRAIRITLLDEIDKYETTKEGDPVLLAEERTSSFKDNSLHIRTCSPTWVETSRIYKSYLESDQRRPYVKCPHCRYEQTLDFFRHVHWNKSPDETEHYPFTAAIYCENCGAEWTEAQRQQIMQTEGGIRWRQTRPFTCCGERQEPIKTRKWKWDEKNQVGLACCTHCNKSAVPNRHAGFGYASKLYSPFITIPELAEKWILSKDDPETKQTFYNTQLGLPFEAQAMKKLDQHALASRREKFIAEVPMGGLVLTAGIDVQAGSEINLGRIEVETVAWGLGEESWSIEYKVINGDPAKPEIWKELDEYLLKNFRHESGHDIFIRGACIDTGGYNTDECYKFARARMGRNIWAIKGASEKGGVWGPVWPIPKIEARKTRLTGYRPVIIGVNSAKESIRQKLLVEEAGPGFAHFPIEYEDARLEQLTAESLVLEKKDGFNRRRWVLKKGHANEALDTRVYAYAALSGLYAVRKLNLSRIAETIEILKTSPTKHEEEAPAGIVRAPASEDVAPATSPPVPPAALPARPRVRRSQFVG